MSIQDVKPVFAWGFSLRPPKWLVPLFNNNMFSSERTALASSVSIQQGFLGTGDTVFRRNPASKDESRERQDPALAAAVAAAALDAEAEDVLDFRHSEGAALAPSTPVRRSQRSAPSPPPLTRLEAQCVVPDLPAHSAAASSPRTARPAADDESSPMPSPAMPSSPLPKPKAAPPPLSHSSGEVGTTQKSHHVRELDRCTDEEIVEMVVKGQAASYALEKQLSDKTRAVAIRRRVLDREVQRGDEAVLGELPYRELDYAQVYGRCCENVIGYVSVPVGLAGPILLDDELVRLPLATTEGCLVASTHRGCKAITASGGAHSSILSNGMTRAPVVRMPSAREAARLKAFAEHPDHFARIAAEFDSTSRYARLQALRAAVAGRYVYLRFRSFTGDAMGMNMVSKGSEQALRYLKLQFPAMEVVSLSGNYCTDKKPAAINWIEGRGRAVTCEATVPSPIVASVLKTTVDDLISLNTAKNYVGSAMAGTLGGFNAHAANVVAAVFIATGQDPAQTVESSQCITTMERTDEGNLYIAITMPCIEVGTLGGGTHLDAQAACLDLLGVRGAHPRSPGSNADKLARIVAAAVLAGELSLNAALAAGHLTQSHMALNRARS